MKEFDDLVDELNLSFRTAPVPDGSFEIEVDGQALDISWGWNDINVHELEKADPRCIWTVLDCDGKLFVANGMHYVNRLYYLVSNEAFRGEMDTFIF
ncbi:hypothetical protein GZ77_21405 [Endozoicomonas montiporae]|uniref:Uncharacterized protein n=2 Tax=Endozoicomonas montiporae TaxID=1027273 RepID=A0A081N3F8_9GAMM|nr:hypothetical protein [Endozoicomonas montiporae]AMO58288.1 hypothetical protein EZMO1_4372 [Endozoicomonas montiporae CL-33]KEQ12981.1 hypothetical protein GZ77_21405 [Endozoicomonas montiporae]